MKGGSPKGSIILLRNHGNICYMENNDNKTPKKPNKKKLIVLAVIVFVSFFFAGLIAGSDITVNEMNKKLNEEKKDIEAEEEIQYSYGDMFEVVIKDKDGVVLRDTDNNVLYTVSNKGYSRGKMTLLVNADGTPKLWTPQLESKYKKIEESKAEEVEKRKAAFEEKQKEELEASKIEKNGSVETTQVSSEEKK